MQIASSAEKESVLQMTDLESEETKANVNMNSIGNNMDDNGVTQMKFDKATTTRITSHNNDTFSFYLVVSDRSSHNKQQP